MSLNGLDSPDVQNAYQTAVAEAGGWFLLKYTSRDSVELLGRGKNGVTEARNAIRDYTEASPLYGLLLYRRRKTLIKYIPEGTSRLLQARTTVHFQDVLERYSPYETLLEITSAESLNDTSLAASFQLHTASPSPSFSRLDEIREDGEDGGAHVLDNPSANTSSVNLSVAQRQKERRSDHLKKRTERAERAASSAPHASANAGESAANATERPTSPLKTSMSQYLVREESGHTSITPITPLESPFSGISEREPEALQEQEPPKKEEPLQKSANLPEPPPETAQPIVAAVVAPEVPTAPERPPPEKPQPELSRITSEDRKLPEPPEELTAPTPLERSATIGERIPKASMDDDPYDLKKYDEWFKPKVKLGPRPVNTPEKTKRPAVARVSGLPGNFKPATKKQEPARPKSSGHGMVPAAGAPPVYAVPASFVPPPIPDTPEYKPRPISRGSVKSAPSHKSTMTPDKLRLMKAIELRKKQLAKSQEQQSTKAPEPPTKPVETPKSAPAAAPPRNPPRVETATPTREQEPEQATDDESQPQSTKADSGIEIHSDKDDSQDEDPNGEPQQQMPVPQNPAQSSASHILTGEHASPPDNVNPSIEPGDAIEGASLDPHADEISSTESQTTERPATTKTSSEELTRVPTIMMADGSRPMTSDGRVQGRSQADVADAKRTSEAHSGSDTLEEPSTSPRRQNSDLAKRRRGYVEPLTLETQSGNPDDFLSESDDDDFLDELHDATVQQATPITVSRSPIGPAFPTRRPSADTCGGSVRSVTIARPATAAGERTLDDRLSPDSVQNIASSPTPPPEKSDSMGGVSRIVSSGISKRIQALADATTINSRPLTPETSPGGYQEPKELKSSAKRPTSFRRHSSNRGSQMASYSTGAENPPSWNIQHDPVTNRNSVSVTARIVRPSVIDESEQDSGPLQHSELIMNRQRDSATASAATTPTTELASLSTSRAQSTQSVASTHTMSPNQSRNSGEIRALHSATRFGRHRQPSSPALDDFPPPPSTTQSQMSLASNDENSAPKEGGRTSRFFKRMSNMPGFGGSKRKSAVQSQASSVSLASSEGVAPTSQPKQRMSVAPEKDTPPAVVVGDLNVQFPDSLLWKRRIVTIDDSGNIQFAIAQAMDIHKGVALKKFPLVNFKAPYAPDLDSQELPYSIVMEFHDETTLQVACEDAMTQRQVLFLLKTHWKAWIV